MVIPAPIADQIARGELDAGYAGKAAMEIGVMVVVFLPKIPAVDQREKS